MLEMSRRGFLRAAGGAAGLVILPYAGMVRGYAANERLRLAVVGVAGYGAYHGFAEAIHTYGNVGWEVSCDVDLRKVQRVYDLWEKRAAEWGGSANAGERKAATEYYGRLAEKRPPLFGDFRRMFDEAADQFDAVVVATPDHTHAVIAAAALRAGKPVLAEKPLTISAHEARALYKLAKGCRLATQMNNHGAAHGGFRRGVEVIREGVIGEVREVHVFFSRGGRNFQRGPQGAADVPAELDWNLWLAQVRWREYHPEWINRIAWRETSIGELGNFGPHSANMAFMGLSMADLWEGGGKIRVAAECSEANQLSYPRWERIRWEAPARGGMGPVAFVWHHGYPPDYAPGSRGMLEAVLRERGASEQQVKDLLGSAGCVVVGTKGVLTTGSHNTDFVLLPSEAFAGVERRRPLTLPSSPGHYREWVEACRGGGRPMANFEYAAPFAEFLAVGSLATRFPGEEIEFDPATGEITNHARAAEFLSYEYRKGWTI